MATPTIYDGLRAYFKFETVGDDGFDSTKNGNPATLTNAAASAPGKLGSRALRPSTSTGNLTLPQNPFINATSNISLAVWVYLDVLPSAMWSSFGGETWFVDKRGGLTSGYALGCLTPGTDQISFRVFNSAGTPYTATFTETVTGAWIHYVGVYEGAVVRLYRNGVSVATAAADGTQRYNGSANLIVGQGLEGALDEVQVWDRKLTAGEVTTLYNAGAGIDIIYPEGFGIELAAAGHEVQPYAADAIDIVLPAAADPAAFDVPALPAYSFTLQTLGAVTAPYSVVDSPQREFIDPLPAITSITVNASHQIVAEAQAGPTDSDKCVTWWEIYLTSGEVVVTADRSSGQDFDSRRTIQDGFGVPPGQSWNGLTAKFFIASVEDGSQVWSSAAFTLNDPNFDNPIPTPPPVYANPNPLVVSISASATHLVTAVGKIGPITANIASPTLVCWWEVELTSGEFTAVAAESVIASASQITITDTWQIPFGIGLSGRQARLAARSPWDYSDVWYSASILLTGNNFNNLPVFVDPTPPVPPPIDPAPVVPTQPLFSGAAEFPRFDPVPVRPELTVRLNDDLTAIIIGRTSDERGDLPIEVQSNRPNVIGFAQRSYFMLRDRSLAVPIAAGANGDALLTVRPVIRSHVPGQLLVRVAEGFIVPPEEM